MIHRLKEIRQDLVNRLEIANLQDTTYVIMVGNMFFVEADKIGQEEILTSNPIPDLLTEEEKDKVVNNYGFVSFGFEVAPDVYEASSFLSFAIKKLDSLLVELENTRLAANN